MNRSRQALILAMLLVGAHPRIANAQAAFKFCAASTQDQNLRLEGTFGFSASFVNSTSTYKLYATTFMNRLKWNSAQTAFDDILNSAICTPALGQLPTAWDPRCLIDNIGLFAKTLPSASTNSLWDAYPGVANVDTVPSPTVSPVWPRTNDYGVSAFTPVLTRIDVNNVFPSPPLTGNQSVCHPYDLACLATAVSNSKPVQVFWSGGVNAWYMVLNENINLYGPLADPPPNGFTSSDNWRVLWAHSADGANWIIDSQLLFRSVNEGLTDFCGGGLLVTDMLIDDAKFYVALTEVGTDFLYLVRAQINSTPNSVPGYYPNGWSVATYPIVNGEYTWTTIPLGTKLDLIALDAVAILPARDWPPSYQVKQASLGRVFDPTGDGFRYYAVTSDHDALGQDVVQLWSSSSLTRPFAFEATINTAGVTKGVFGWEFGFTHYSDNYPASQGGTPRIRRSGFDFWVAQNLGAVTPLGSISASRRSARLSPVITAPVWTLPNTPGLTASVVAQAGSSYAWIVTGGTITAGQTTPTLTFKAGATAGATMAVQVTETTTASACLQPPGTLSLGTTAKVQIDFADVPTPNLYHDYVDTLARNGVTAGCGSGLYCPDASIQRAEMAVFLLKAKHGASYPPPPATGNVFTDVASGDFAAAFIEQVYHEGIMSQWSGDCSISCSFGPTQLVTRASMAEFLLKAQRGSSYSDHVPPATGIFSDVATGLPSAPWIEQLYREGITAGCQSQPLRYCPDANNTRAEMAVFIVKTLKLL